MTLNSSCDAMWYGRFPHTVIGSPRHFAAILQVVAQRIDLLDLDVVDAGELGAQHRTMSGSRSSAITLPVGHALGEPRGQRAEPGADLDDPVLVGRDTVASTIARNARSEIRKFWPNDFFARRP